MMVIIDMEMPKNCNDCCISIFGCICGKPISDIKDVDTLHERLPDCPLHEFPKGAWIKSGTTTGSIPYIVRECSCCGYAYSMTANFRYCPKCGAKMEVEDESSD